MASFRYRAIDKTGRPARGVLDAVSEVDLELRLQRMGLDLIASKARDDTKRTRAARSRIKRQDLINFCFDMEQMARSGIPLMDGLRDLRDSAQSARFREMLTAIVEDMEGGRMLSQCMAAHPDVFDNVFAGLVKAGEQTGRMTEAFASLAGALKWQDELASQIKRLLIYPALVMVVITAVILFLLVFLVPQMVSLLKTMGIALPAQTRVLVFVSGAVTAYWPFIFGLPAAGAIWLVLLVQRNPKAAYFCDYAKLRVPVTGPILQKIILARFANFFGLMYQSGITVLDALKTCEAIVDNRVIADGVMRAGQQISAGENITEAFRSLGMFPPLVVRMLHVGETTGALDTALSNVNYFYIRDVRDSVDKVLKLLEPGLTLVLGIILAFIMWSVLSPVYEILGKLRF